MMTLIKITMRVCFTTISITNKNNNAKMRSKEGNLNKINKRSKILIKCKQEATLIKVK